jgi:hypothetical protein
MPLRDGGQHPVEPLRRGPGRRVPDQELGQYGRQCPRPYRRRQLAVEDGRQCGQWGGPAQRVVSLDADVQQHAQRPQVRCRFVIRAADALGGHVFGGANEFAGGS